MMRQATRWLLSAALYTGPLLGVLLTWEAAARLGFVRALFLPSVTAVLVEGANLFRSGDLGGPLLVSLYRALLGLVIAVVLGTLAGVLMARMPRLRWWLDPLVSLAFPAPKIAFVPIFILWFGIDDLSKVLLVAFSCVFPMLIVAYHATTEMPQRLLWSARTMGTGDAALLHRVVLPAILPDLFSGLRTTLPIALVTAFTAEMVAGGGGVGSALMYAQRLFETASAFAYILVMLLTGFIADRLLLALRRWIIPWQPED